MDGEVVALDESGRPSFNRLQNYRSGHPLLYIAFDILFYVGKSMLDASWQERRELLRKVLPEHPLIQLSVSLESDAATVVKSIRELGLEGIVAKRRTSLYEPGKRTGAWIKHRLRSGQE